jgi:glycyl-tRNA synthetase
MDMDKLVALCRRKGFIFQSSEIYGGINGFWDYGPLGVELKKNIKDAWWHDMVRNPPPGPDGEEIAMVGVDCALIMNPKVWEASGHVKGFADPMVDDKETKQRFRADQLCGAWRLEESSDPSTQLDEQLLLGGLDALNPACTFIASTHVDGLDEFNATYARKHRLRFIEATGRFRVLVAVLQREKQPTIYEKWVIRMVPQMLLAQKHDSIPSPFSGKPGTLTPPRSFNLMLKTYIGALEDASAIAYLRPETAQGIFVNFHNVLDSTRLKLPFGIAQVGKAFRNEINPRNYTFRSREFEQMEIEFFCRPDESMKWYQYWRDVRIKWYSQLGIKSDKLRPREQGKEELAHYSIGTTDIEYLFPFSDEPQELEGVAHRGDYDLTQHAKHSGKDLSYFDEEAWVKADKSAFAGDKRREAEEKAKYRFVPHVIEPSAGADRFTLAVLCEAYDEDTIGGEQRVVMRFHPRLAPIKAAIFPLVNKEGMPEKAHALYRELKREYNVFYDDKGAVGRRYRRQDEAGTPFCVTIDGQTLQDNTVTIRDRDSTQQWRVPIGGVADELRKRLQP